ncbi:MAG: hypothetical protein MUO31_13110 [Thermodesulfovibrionales bacterium]|nr:hypothetical protein [Thermodesulfovibrionales bacterium]
MSERMYIKCVACNDKELLSKRFTLDSGWKFYCIPDGGISIINADSAEELKAQLEVGLNNQDKMKVLMLDTFNEWLYKHCCCDDFVIEMDLD